LNFLLGRGRLEIEQSLDVAAHFSLLALDLAVRIAYDRENANSFIMADFVIE
jgi:hypothetical protein